MPFCFHQLYRQCLEYSIVQILFNHNSVLTNKALGKEACTVTRRGRFVVTWGLYTDPTVNGDIQNTGNYSNQTDCWEQP
jgi:hypothetical protein